LRFYQLDILCPTCNNGTLVNDRTNYSKNKILFPIFQLDGPPQWCMVMSMTCRRCRSRHGANDGEILTHLPSYISSQCPVEPKYALKGNNSHLGRTSTQVFDMLMTTYGNGDLCSRLLFNTLNQTYLERVSSYYSYHVQAKTKDVIPYVEKDGHFIKTFPPLGDTIREAYDDASNSINNKWGISDHDRHTREIQGVKCSRLYAEDHTHEVTKNYFGRRRLGAFALWDVSTETGEIATAVLVPSTKATDLSHAALSLSWQQQFLPKAMYSDRWPVNVGYWAKVFGTALEGRLGLFHFTQRITKTLRKWHIDYFVAINGILDAIYFYNQLDYEALLIALKDGTLNGKTHSEEEIADLKATRLFRQRYGKYLRKEIRPPHIMRTMLDQWFVRYKCTASEGSLPAMGRLDPLTKETLFTPDTKPAIENCKDKCQYLQDPLPLEEMYDTIKPSPNSRHGLTECLSRRGESNLESFHLLLAHFGNNGMRASLADNLNLTGTARYNLQVRHKLRLSRKPQETRAMLPSSWETIVPYCNHSELAFVNDLAVKAGVVIPFAEVEPLIKDNGERFFSEYLSWLRKEKPKQDVDGLCLCSTCTPTGTIPSMINDRVDVQPTPIHIQGSVAPSNVPARRQTETETPLPIPTLTSPPRIPTVSRPQPILLPICQQPFTFWCHPFFSTTPLWPQCCRKYNEYCSRIDRRGRPPHDLRCPNRRTTMPDKNK